MSGMSTGQILIRSILITHFRGLKIRIRRSEANRARAYAQGLSHFTHHQNQSALLNRITTLTTFTTIASVEAVATALDGVKYLEARGMALGVISVQEMHGRISKIEQKAQQAR